MEKNVLILHRTQGKGVEAVHMLGVAKGFQKSGCATNFVSPPGVKVSSGETKKGRAKALAKYAPQLLFEALEFASNWTMGKRLQAAKEYYGCDLIFERYAFVSWAGVKKANEWNIPLILEINYTSLDDLDLRRRTKITMPLLKKVERHIFEKADLLMPVSSFLAQELKGMGIPDEKILISPNAVDLDIFNVDNQDAALKEELKLKEGPVIGFVGSFAPWHRVDLLIDACINLAQKYENINMLLIGEGKMRPLIERRLLKIKSINSIFTGHVSHDKIHQYIQLMDIPVMPDSNNYGSPMKVFEYMAMSKAVVAPDYSPLRDAINDGEDGILFKPGKLDELQSALDRLLTDAGLRAEISKNARLRVENEHNWKNRMQKAIERLDELSRFNNK
jgi:glycosyltransferase involved in cell wall biosynthesis